MRPAYRWLGSAAALACLAWLAFLAWRHAGSLPDLSWGPRQVLAVGAAVGLYVLSLSLGAVAWRLMLREVPGAEISLARALVISGLANAAKYLPGNVGQYVGRTALARQHGVRVEDVLVTLGFETGWMIFSAVTLAACAALAPGWSPAVLAVAGVAAPLLLVALLNRWRPRFLERPLVPPRPATLAACFGLYWLAFFACGGALDGLVRELFGREGRLGRITAVWAGAWVAGFVTPGAPGGLGVREAVLVAGLKPVYGPGAALGLALVFRLVSVLGDALAFAAAAWGRHRLEKSSSSSA